MNAVKNEAKIKYTLSQKIRWLRLLMHSRSSRLNETVAMSLVEKLPVPAPVVFDIGANIGLFVKAFNKSQNKPKAILAFEPSSYVYSILKLTVARFKNVICHKLAFDEKDGETTLKMPLKKSGSIRVGLSHIGQTPAGDYLEETVPTKTLDHFIAESEHDHVDLVKIDVEGAEFAILKGSDHVLNTLRPHWFVEVSETAGRFSSSKQDTFDKFIRHDYVAFYFDKEGNWCRAERLLNVNDYLFIPSENVKNFLR